MSTSDTRRLIVEHDSAETQVIRIRSVAVDSVDDKMANVVYAATVSDGETALATVDKLLAPLRVAENHYRAHPVIAASAIETSGVNILKRVSRFNESDTDQRVTGAEDFRPDPIDESNDSTELASLLDRSVNRRAEHARIGAALADAEALLSETERVLNQDFIDDATDPATLSDDTNLAPVDGEPAQIRDPRLPDASTIRHMRFLIEAREASQNLARIRRLYRNVLLVSIPIGALMAAIGFGITSTTYSSIVPDLAIVFGVILPIVSLLFVWLTHRGEARRWKEKLQRSSRSPSRDSRTNRVHQGASLTRVQ